MRKTIVFGSILILAVLVLVGAGCGEKEPGEESLTDILSRAKDVTSFKYDMVATTPGETAVTTTMWRKGEKMRMEGTFEGKSMVYLVDAGQQLAYVYFPAENTAMKIDLSKAQETAGDSPTEQSGSVMDYNPVTLGTEVLDGKTCLVIEYTDEIGETKMWLWTRYGFPIKTEITTAQGISVVELKNIDFGNISDSMFELPAGVQLMTIPSFGF